MFSWCQDCQHCYLNCSERTIFQFITLLSTHLVLLTGLACDNQSCEHVRTSCYQSEALFVIPVFQQLYLLQQSVDTVQKVLIICMVNTHISHIWEHPPSPRGSFWSNIYVPKHQKLLKDQLLCILIFLFIFKGNVRIDVDACCECQAAEAVWKREGEAEIRG